MRACAATLYLVHATSIGGNPPCVEFFIHLRTAAQYPFGALMRRSCSVAAKESSEPAQSIRAAAGARLDSAGPADSSTANTATDSLCTSFSQGTCAAAMKFNEGPLEEGACLSTLPACAGLSDEGQQLPSESVHSPGADSLPQDAVSAQLDKELCLSRDGSCDKLVHHNGGGAASPVRSSRPARGTMSARPAGAALTASLAAVMRRNGARAGCGTNQPKPRAAQREAGVLHSQRSSGAGQSLPATGSDTHRVAPVAVVSDEWQDSLPPSLEGLAALAAAAGLYRCRRGEDDATVARRGAL